MNQKTPDRTSLSQLTLSGLLAAMITLTTAYILHIPYGTNGGYLHFGDTLIYLAAALLPQPYALAAAAIGGGMADLLTAPVWAPATILIKILITLPFTSHGPRLLIRRNILALFVSFLISAIGYYVAEWILFGSCAALLSITGSLIQSGGSSFAFLILAAALDRLHIKNESEVILMADILYTYHNQLYANITNRCNCNCRFCIRSHTDTLGSAREMWHQTDPTVQDIKNALDHYDLSGYSELVFCGYGEPTCALDTLLETAEYAKEVYGLRIRLNTNGLGSLQHKTNIVPRLATVIDTISISLNAPDADSYQHITRPDLPDAYPALLDFARECKKYIPHVSFTIVDVLTTSQQQACQQLADTMHIPLRIRHYI